MQATYMHAEKALSCHSNIVSLTKYELWCVPCFLFHYNVGCLELSKWKQVKFMRYQTLYIHIVKVVKFPVFRFSVACYNQSSAVTACTTFLCGAGVYLYSDLWVTVTSSVSGNMSYVGPTVNRCDWGIWPHPAKKSFFENMVVFILKHIPFPTEI